MAQINKLQIFQFENELASMRDDDGDFYEVNGRISQEDIEKINSMYRKSIIILKNTNGLSSEFLNSINNDNIYFSIIGGLDYFNKDKYKTNEYYERTLVSKDGLVEIIKYFESIEKYVNPNWSELEKAMFVYSCISEDFKYDEKYDNYLQRGIVERSLNGILYKKLVCAGFAQVYKEAMDRLEIECIYQNKRNYHSFNVLKIEDKYYGLDLTWDCSERNKKQEDYCDFIYFGMENRQKFYSRAAHNVSKDSQETIYNLSVISPELKEKLLDNIKNARNNRRKEKTSAIIKDNIKYYPLDSKRQKFAEEACKLSEMYKILMVLKVNEKINAEEFEELSKDVIVFYNIAGDLVPDKKFGMKYSRSELLGVEIGLSDEYSFGLTKNTINSPNGRNFEHPTNDEMSVHTLNQENLQNILTMLEQKFYDLKSEYLISIFSDSENIINKLNRINSIIDKDANILIEKSFLESKIHFINANKNELLSKGIGESKFNETINRFTKYMDVAYPKEDYSQLHHNTSLEVLENALLDFYVIKQICESHDEKKYSFDEWRNLYLDLSYLKSIIDFSKFDGITDEEIQSILNKNILIYDKQVEKYLEKMNNQSIDNSSLVNSLDNVHVQNGFGNIEFTDSVEEEINEGFFR